MSVTLNGHVYDWATNFAGYNAGKPNADTGQPNLISIMQDMVATLATAVSVTTITPGAVGSVLVSDGTNWHSSSAISQALINPSGAVFGTDPGGTDLLRVGGAVTASGAATVASINLGGSSSSFPSLKRSTTTLKVRLADDSADAPLTAGALTLSGTLAGTSVSLSGDVIAGASGKLGWASSSYLASSADGYVALYNNAGTGFTGLRFGGTSASFPMLKVSATTLKFRLADDSADAPITAGAATFSGLVNSTNRYVGSVATNSTGSPMYAESSAGTTGLFCFAAATSAGGCGLSTGGTERLRADGLGNVVMGKTALATTATDGFLYVAGGAGAPTGTPTAQGSAVPLYIDTTNKKFYARIGGAWVGVALA